MKKSSKTILISSLAVLPIIPTVTMLTSCGTQTTFVQPEAEWTSTFNNVQTFTLVTDASDLKQKMMENALVGDRPILERICIPLKISLQQGFEVRLVEKTLNELDNNLYFQLIVGRNLDDNNTLTMTKYSCAITNINPNQNNSFNNQLISNNIIKDPIKNELGTIINIETPNLQQKPVATPNIALGTTKISSNSTVVKEYLNTLQQTYTLVDTPQQKSNLKSDIEFLIKKTFLSNLESWKIPYALLDTFNAFGNVTIKTITRNSVNLNFYLQIQNTTKESRNFIFFKNNVTLKPNDVLTINVSCPTINQNNILNVDQNGNVCLNLENLTVKYQIGNNEVTLENQTLENQKSNSLNLTLNNVGGNNTQFNPQTQTEFETIFKNNIDKLSVEEIQNAVQERIQAELTNKHKETLINFDIIEQLAAPAITDGNLGKYDVDGNGIYTLFDLFANLGTPFGKWYRFKNMTDVAVIMENVFSGKPLYSSFRGLFPSLVNILRGMNSIVVNDIVDFLEQSLTVNGQLKTEQQFRDFFVNISNLKEVVKPLLQNSGAVSGYQLETILQLIDTLAENPDQTTLWHWLAFNFKRIVNLINILLPLFGLPASVLDIVKPIITDLSNMELIYNGQSCNLMFDIPLYNFFSREGLTINNPVKILKNFFSTTTEDLILPTIDKLNTNMVADSLLIVAKQILRLLAAWNVQGYKTANWINSFKSFWFPKTFNGQENATKKTVKDIFNETQNIFTLSNVKWSDLNINLPSDDKNLNKHLSFDVTLPDIQYNYVYAEKNFIKVYQEKTAIKTTQGVKYDYFLPNFNPTPLVVKENGKSNVTYKISHYKKTNGLSPAFCLRPEGFRLSSFIGTKNLAENQTYFDSYNPNLYDDSKVLSLINASNVWKPSFTLASDFIINEKIDKNNVRYFLNETAYLSLLDQFNQNDGNNINLNSLLFKPLVYVLETTNKKVKTYQMTIQLPFKMGIKEWDATNNKEIISFKDVISLPITVA